MNALLDAIVITARGLAALAAGVLPRRRWQSLPGLPIEPLAWLSGLTTLVAGFAVGVGGFLRFAWEAAGGVVDAALTVGERQVHGQARGEITSFSMQGANMFALPAFLFFTPLGLLATYLTVSGFARAVAAWADDPTGDPILTGLDALTRRSASSVRQTRARRAREREEGAEVPDRLLRAAAAGAGDFDYVVVSSRRKPDWTAGTFVITSEQWYTLGKPFEVRLPEGLRTIYPLKEQKVAEVLRRSVQYELPPLEEGEGLNLAIRAPRGAPQPRGPAGTTTTHP